MIVNIVLAIIAIWMFGFLILEIFGTFSKPKESDERYIFRKNFFRIGIIIIILIGVYITWLTKMLVN